MTSTGSSYLSKSKKDFKPKAPVRRSGAPGSSQTSVRGSVDRQVQSQTQTPQPIAPKHHVPHTSTVVAPVAIAVPPPVPDKVAPAAKTSTVNATLIPISSRVYDHVPKDADTATLGPLTSKVPGTRVQPTRAPQAHTRDGSDVPRPRSPLARTLSPVRTRASMSITNRQQSIPQDKPQNISSTSQSSAEAHRPDEDNDQPTQPPPKRRKINHTPATDLATPHESSASADHFPSSIEAEQDVAQAGPSTENEPTAVQPVTKKATKTKSKFKATQRAEDIAAAIVADASLEAPARKASKKSKNNQSTGESAPAVVSDAPRAPIRQKQRVNAKKKQSAEEVAAATVADATRSPVQKKPTKAKGKQRAKDIAAEVVADATQEPSGQFKEGKRRGRKRAITPESAETVEIAPSIVKMADLCKDIRIGKKSTREMELQELDWTELVRKQREKKQRVANKETPPPETVDEMLERVARERGPQDTAQAIPDTRIVNGQIVIDENSLRIDRHANAETAREAEGQEVIDENQLTRRINAGSWMKREKTEAWTEDLTNLFYDGLRMFGTDFQMLSKLFPGRNRRQIKLKFVREERLDPDKIKQTLLGERIPVDMEEFSALTNTVYRDPQDLVRDMAADKDRLEEEQRMENAARDEALKEREDVAATENAAAGGESSAKENEVQGNGLAEVAKKAGKRSKKPGTKTTKKSSRSKAPAGTGEMEVLASIEDTAQ